MSLSKHYKFTINNKCVKGTIYPCTEQSIRPHVVYNTIGFYNSTDFFVKSQKINKLTIPVKLFFDNNIFIKIKKTFHYYPWKILNKYYEICPVNKKITFLIISNQDVIIQRGTLICLATLQSTTESYTGK